MLSSTCQSSALSSRRVAHCAAWTVAFRSALQFLALSPGQGARLNRGRQHEQVHDTGGEGRGACGRAWESAQGSGGNRRFVGPPVGNRIRSPANRNNQDRNNPKAWTGMWPDVQKDLTPVRRKRINRNATERNLDVACRNKDLAVFRRANPTAKHDPPPSLTF